VWKWAGIFRVAQVVSDGPGIGIGHVLEFEGRADIAECPYSRSGEPELVDDYVPIIAKGDPSGSET
jgi:hypothetical protein